jgi:hypothetical protein
MADHPGIYACLNVIIDPVITLDQTRTKEKPREPRSHGRLFIRQRPREWKSCLKVRKKRGTGVTAWAPPAPYISCTTDFPICFICCCRCGGPNLVFHYPKSGPSKVVFQACWRPHRCPSGSSPNGSISGGFTKSRRKSDGPGRPGRPTHLTRPPKPCTRRKACYLRAARRAGA